MDSEKKIKLEDLPEDSGREPPKKKNKKPKEEEPRITGLKDKDSEGRLFQMSRKWIFDVAPVPYGLISLVVSLVCLELTGIASAFMNEVFPPSVDFMWEVKYLFSHPILFILIPILFIAKDRKTEFYVEVTFDGLSLPQKVNLAPRELNSRTKIKWGEISKVKINTQGKRPVIELNSPTKLLGEIFWDLKIENKRAFKIVLMGLISPDHPLRSLLEKEVK